MSRIVAKTYDYLVRIESSRGLKRIAISSEDPDLDGERILDVIGQEVEDIEAKLAMNFSAPAGTQSTIIVLTEQLGKLKA